MKQNSLILPIVGGGVAFLCFFFPWIAFDMSSLDLDLVISQLEGSITIAGFRMAISGGNLFTSIAFLATLTILGVCIYMLNQKTPWKARSPVLISSGIGLLFMVFTLIQFFPGANPDLRMVSDMLKSTYFKIDMSKLISPQFGGFGVAIGFIVALIGAWNIPKSDTSMKNNEQEVTA